MKVSRKRKGGLETDFGCVLREMFHIKANFIRYMESSNPVLKSGFRDLSDSQVGIRMSLNGTIMKTAALLFLVFCSATYTWYQVTHGENFMPWVIGGLVGALVLCLVTVFKKEWAAFTSPAYALCEGLFLGAVSAVFETRYPGLVLNAVGLTLSVLFVMLRLVSSMIFPLFNSIPFCFK